MNWKKRVVQLEEELKQTKEALKKALKRIEELEGIVKEKSKPAFVKEEVKAEPRKSGQKEGHVGYTRRIPERIDVIKELKIDRCPYCNTRLGRTQETRERVVTDIEIRTINAKYVIHRKYCKHCKKIVEPLVTDALPNSRFGLRLMLLVLVLKLDSRIPSNKVTSILNSVFGIKISDGEIYNILEKLSRAYGDYYDSLVKRIKEALIKNIDETSWRINGRNNWLWIFINKEAALYIVNQKRSSNVPVDVLGNQEGKFGITDRHSAYNILVEKTGISQQVCWAHLLRNTKDLAKYYPEAKYIHKRMKYIYAKAKEGKTSKERLLHWIDLMRERGKSFRSMNTKKFLRSICVNHREDLFRFVDNPEIEPTNNRAEGGLRHAVIIRKISNGSRSEKGAEITTKLLSVLQTAKLQNDNPMIFLSNLLQKGK